MTNEEIQLAIDFYFMLVENEHLTLQESSFIMYLYNAFGSATFTMKEAQAVLRPGLGDKYTLKHICALVSTGWIFRASVIEPMTGRNVVRYRYQLADKAVPHGN